MKICRRFLLLLFVMAFVPITLRTGAADRSDRELERAIGSVTAQSGARISSQCIAEEAGKSLSVYAAKTVMSDNGTPPRNEWYLLCDAGNNLYRTTDMVTKEFLLKLSVPSGRTANWSCGITKDNDIIFVADAAGLSTAKNGRLNDDNRINPIYYLASENYEIRHTLDFGSSLKPCGWFGNAGFCVLPNGNIVFAEYTRGTVRTANVWLVDGDFTDVSNWRSTWSVNIIDTTDTTTPGTKHCHEVAYDFYTGIVYFGTGDSQSGSLNFYSTDNGETWTQLAAPSKARNRRLNFIFTPDRVYWASDSYEAKYHYFFIAERDSVTHAVDVENATAIALGSYNAQACYGCVYLKSLRIIVMMDRCDSDGSKQFVWKCYDIDANEIKTIGIIRSIGGKQHLGFRCRFIEWYPSGNAILCGFSPRPTSVNPDINVNALCGNGQIGAANKPIRVNHLFLYIERNGDGFSFRAETRYRMEDRNGSRNPPEDGLPYRAARTLTVGHKRFLIQPVPLIR